MDNEHTPEELEKIRKDLESFAFVQDPKARNELLGDFSMMHVKEDKQRLKTDPKEMWYNILQKFLRKMDVSFDDYDRDGGQVEHSFYITMADPPPGYAPKSPIPGEHLEQLRKSGAHPVAVAHYIMSVYLDPRFRLWVYDFEVEPDDEEQEQGF